jgi:hypothetical protein
MIVKELKTYVFGFAALAGLFVSGSLIQSRESQAKGAYSTPVTVMNTNANPGSTLDAGIAGRIPYVSTANFPCGPGVSECTPLFTAAPSGFRLVIENVSGDFKLTTGTTIPPNGEVGFINAGSPAWGFSAPIGPTNGSTQARFSQPIMAYADPSDGQLVVRVDGNWASGTSQTVTLSGYLINCSLTPCPTIQH